MSITDIFHSTKAVLTVLSLLTMVITPFSIIVMAEPLGSEMKGQFELKGEEKPWWEDWPGDSDGNKIDDNLERFILDENLKSEDEILVLIELTRKPTPDDEYKLTSFGWNVTYVSKYIDCMAVKLSVSDIEKLALINWVAMVNHAPDGEFTLNSALPSINVPAVWQKLGYDGEDITIAIIDTGIDDEHQGLDDLDDNPDTDDPKVIAFYDAQNHPNQDDGTYEPYDNHGHGTHCSGIAAGTGAPGGTYIGVAPQATLVGVKIGGGSIPYDAALRGVEWAIDNKDKFGIDILSNSWGLYIGGPANQNGNSQLSRLMDEAVDAGLVVFCAAGNTAVSMTVYSPADSEKAMAVGSVNDNHDLSYFSSQGPTADGRIKPDICTIGEGVRSPNANSGSGYGDFSGTSAACPMAAGLAALMLQANPDLSPDDVKQILHETSEHNTDARFPVSPNNGYGWGVVEAFGAVKRSRDLTMTFISAPSVVHEGDIIGFVANSTYTRTIFTYKGEDGMRIIGDDVLIFTLAIPADWSIPFNLSFVSEGDLDPDIFYSMPRLENGMWIIEAEFHYNENVNQTTDVTPMIIFDSITPDVDFDTEYSLFLNITLNNINATKVVKNITVDAQEPPIVDIENPEDGDPVSGVVSIFGTSYDPDMGDDVDRVEILITNQEWEIANGTNSWHYIWNTTVINNGQYQISVRAFDGEEFSEQINITVHVDNFNLQPTAIIDSITPNPANEGEDVSFSGHGNDEDGYLVDYEWWSSIDGFLSDETVFSTSTLSVGTHDISFMAKDNDGVWSQKTIVSLRINQFPNAYIDLISPNPANEGDTVYFAGHGSDDRNIVSYNWRSDIDGFLSNLPSFDISSLSVGWHDIYFRVQDDDGQWSDEVSSSLRINQIPHAFIDSVSPNPARETETVSFSGHGTDDSGIIDYEWLSDIDGFLSMMPSFDNSSLSSGDHIIYFRVKDDDNVWSDYVLMILTVHPIPKAYIDSISPNPANESEPVTFQGHGTDEGEIINYNWSSNFSGVLSNKASFTRDNLSSGIHTIFFSVQNDKGIWSDEVSQELRINGKPTAFIDTLSPNPALIGELVQFEGHGIDDDKIIAYNWHSSLNGFLNNSSSFSTSQLLKGTHTISLKVQDSDYLWSEEVLGSLRIHERPKAHIDSISPNPANEGSEVSFSGHGSDDSTILSYEWRSDINGSLSAEASFSTPYLIAGQHEISFRVMDSDGIWSDYTVTSLRINELPVAIIESISPNPANEGESVKFSGNGTDDGTVSGYSWRSSLNGFLSASSSFSTTELYSGNHVIYFKVMDDDDAWSEEVELNLRINQIPIAYIDSISPKLANDGDEVSFQGYGTDDGNIADYEWTSSINGILSDKPSFIISSLSLGEHIITFKVMDDFGAWSKEVWMILKINQIPVAVIDLVTPNPALDFQNFYFEGHGIDDEEIAEYYWSSSIDGYLGDSETLTWVGLSVGQHTITFKVKDKNGVWSQEKYLKLKVHSRPTAKIISIIPESPTDNELITFIGDGVDDGIITAYNWTSNLKGFLSHEKEFDAKLEPGTHSISLTVMDEMGIWSKAVVKKVQVNGVPEAEIDSVFPNPAQEGETVNLLGHGTDDSRIVAYEWRSNIDGIIGSESSIALSDLSVGTHTIYFKVKDDKDVWSVEDFTSLNISAKINQPPTINILTPFHGEVFSGVINIQAVAHDPDGEVKRIEVKVDDGEWYKISDTSEASYSLETKDLSKGDHVIHLRAYDGEDYSSEKSVIVSVEPVEEEGMFNEMNRDLVIALAFIIFLLILFIIFYIIAAARKRRRMERDRAQPYDFFY